MNRSEFNDVMSKFGINNPLSTTNINGSIEDVHYWNDLAIWFGGSNYTEIKGKIPLEVANKIYEKYPGNPYGIRVLGAKKNCNPIKYAKDENAISEGIERYLDIDDYIEKCENPDDKEIIENKYFITSYQIDSVRGLLIFLTEIKDYYLRKNEKNKLSMIGQMFRIAILNFDNAVNPFLDNNINIDDINNYPGKTKINGVTYNSQDGIYRNGCFHIEIANTDTNNYTMHDRTLNGFSFKVIYKLDDKKFIKVEHKFLTSKEYECEKGEYLVINYYGDNIKKEIFLVFDIENGMIGDYKNKIPATMEQISYVYDELLKATEYAKRITTEKLKGDNNQKNLTIHLKLHKIK